jgi:hypothetical protein
VVFGCPRTSRRSLGLILEIRPLAARVGLPPLLTKAASRQLPCSRYDRRGRFRDGGNHTTGTSRARRAPHAGGPSRRSRAPAQPFPRRGRRRRVSHLAPHPTLFGERDPQPDPSRHGTRPDRAANLTAIKGPGRRSSCGTPVVVRLRGGRFPSSAVDAGSIARGSTTLRCHPHRKAGGEIIRLRRDCGLRRRPMPDEPCGARATSAWFPPLAQSAVRVRTRPVDRRRGASSRRADRCAISPQCNRRPVSSSSSRLTG